MLSTVPDAVWMSTGRRMFIPPDAAWTPLDAAAKHLGISPDATRKRIERGTLKGEKRGGRWMVDLSDLDAAAATSPDADQAAGVRAETGRADAIRTPLHAAPDSLRELVDHLKTENEFLRDQLDKRSQELADERERSDVLHREAFARIEVLTSGLSPFADTEPNEAVDDDPPEPVRKPLADDDHLAQVQAFVAETKRFPASRQTTQDAPGAMIAPSPSNVNEDVRHLPRTGFWDFWARLLGR